MKMSPAFGYSSSCLDLPPFLCGEACRNANLLLAKRGYHCLATQSGRNGSSNKVAITSHLMPGQHYLEEGYSTGKHQLQEAKHRRQKVEFVRTLLIDNYDSYTYNIYQELSVVNGVPPVVVRNDEWTWEEVCHYLYEERAFDNIVISPGPGSPARAADIGICLRLLLECKDIPILGVCLGHQALGFVHGARIVHASEPVHGRMSEIEHNGCELFDTIPSGLNSGFKVVRYHSLVIDPESLPKELIPIAWTSSTGTLSFLDTPNTGSPKNLKEEMFSWALCILPGHTMVYSFTRRVLQPAMEG